MQKNPMLLPAMLFSLAIGLYVSAKALPYVLRAITEESEDE